MTTGKFISQLEALIKKLESLVQSLQCSTSHPSQKQYQTLAELGLRLIAGAKNLPIQVAALKTRRAKPSFEEGRKLIAQAQSDRKDLIATAQLKDRVIFARNITYFFDGQRDSVVDSDATKARKQLTRERCERVCTLSPDGLIFWAVAFKPTIWTANVMSKDTFDYVFDYIEPDGCQVWPPDIYYILRGLAAEEPLQGSHKYHEFLKAAEDDMKKAQSTTRPRKRRRVSDGAPSQASTKSKTNIELERCDSQACERHNVDQQQRTEESTSDILRLEPTGIGTTGAPLSHDSNTSTTGLATTQDSICGSEDGLTESVSGIAGTENPVAQESDAAPKAKVTPSLRAIQFEKHTVQQIVLERPTDILGGIWFGSPPGFKPFVSLRLSGVLGNIIKLSGQEVLLPEPTPDTSGTFTGVYSIELECLRQLIQRDGFGTIFWNEYGGEAFVAIEVINEELIADFIQTGQAAIGALPMLDTVSTSSST